MISDTVMKMMEVAAIGWADERQHGEYRLEEFYQAINKVHPMNEKSFRRMLTGLGLVKNERGFYTYAHIVVVLGWIQRRDRFYSYAEYMQCAGTEIYKRSQGIDFGKFVSYEGMAHAS